MTVQIAPTNYVKSLFAFGLIAFGLIWLTGPQAARADATLITDISSHLISVESDFTGTELLLFGAIQRPEGITGQDIGDVIIVIRGPQEKIVVRRKDRIAGIWINADSLSFSAVPGFYAVASSRPVEQITDANTLKRLSIGSKRLQFSDQPDAETNQFRQAIIRQRTASGLYTDTETTITFLGDMLFRSNINFPANVPVGNYTAEFYLFRNGDLISAQTSPLFIKKFGVGRSIYDFAQNYPGSYGIIAIIAALLAGWIASVVFRRN